MNSSQRAALSSVSQPLKSAALRSSLGSLIGIKALLSYLRTHPVAREDCLPIAPTILPGLVQNQIPPIPSSDSSVQQAIQCAALSLSNLSHLVNSIAPRNSEDRISELIPLSKFFITHRAKIFPWLSFIQRYYFHPGLNPKPLYPPISEMSDFLVLHAVAGFIKLLDCTTFQIDYTPYQEIVDMVLEFWHKCLLVDYDDTNPFELRIAQDTNRIVFDFLKRELGRNSLRIVDTLGGPSGVMALHLCWMEKSHQLIKASKTKPLRAYMLHTKVIEHSLGLFAHEPLRQQLDHLVVSCVSKIFLWLLKDRSRVAAKEGIGSEIYHEIDAVVILYCVFIACSPPTSQLHPLLDALRLGVIKALRTELSHFNIVSGRPVPSDALHGTINDLMVCSVLFYPFAKHAKKLLQLPCYGTQVNDWMSFDRLLGSALWSYDQTLGASQTFSRCSTCDKPYDVLRVCSKCHVTLYCSTECQRTDWQRDHKFVCQLFQLSGSAHFLVKTNNLKGLGYLAHQELIWRLDNNFVANIRKLLSYPRVKIPSDGLPFISFQVNAPQLTHTVQSYRDFPDLFGEDDYAFWHTTLAPRLKAFIQARMIPEFVVVVYLPFGENPIPVLSPLHTLAVAGIKPLKEWVINGKSENLFP